MFYIVNLLKPSPKAPLGSKEFENIIRDYVIDVSELSHAQYQTFIGALSVLDLYKEFIPDVSSHYVVGFSPNE